ncbi:MAG: CBS domain-containing protein [Candidatus Krumholzibacteria bacterium]|jgi:CBS domain-containing protein|nr:CBS domain-containing protein [Candidatus Krumholzibacteria bacterium]MDP6669826.1 CBS domain-containing protein [Candidatus Krumholzibacteria bacterium]MDP6796916.1 CBS domain-containing protein [Candidatus Krumholzibacteria bacterium]MDP7021437.1 CBS domain-containing protein [Candidatus Krumholzibacteria bacterium]
MAKVKDVLSKKGREVHSIRETDSVSDAAFLMNRYRIGCLLVLAEESVIGIFTERDILTQVVAPGRDPETTKVKDVMTSPVAACGLDTELEECRAVMTEKRIRHLPVVEEGKLEGIIASGDIMAWEAVAKQETIDYLYDYLYGKQP